MRLIDADALMEHIWRDKLDSRELIAKMVDDAPTIFAERKGKWEKRWHSVFKEEIPCCSVCNNFMAFRWKFCPNCGAEMEDET